MKNKFINLPKIELHLHLDGSLSLEMASKLSNLPIVELKEKMIAKDKCVDLSEYLTKFSFPISLMQTKENLELVAKDLAMRLSNENVIYAEIRFAPMFHTQKGLTYEEIVESVLKGLKSINKIQTNLILCLMRGANEQDNIETLNIAKRYLNKGVCAIDLAGDEKRYPTIDYRKFFELAKQNHIPYTIHAGEARGAEEVKTAIELGAKRIGHGIHCIENKEVMNLIKTNNVLLEVCPTSNIQTNAIDTYKNHPIKKLYDKGILISINTDNSTVSNISISQEYLKLYTELNFNSDEFKKINLNSINNAFLSKEEKDNLIKKYYKFNYGKEE